MSSVEGMDELLATLSGLGGNMKKTLRLGISQANERIKAQAKYNCPVKTGNLRNSIHSYSRIEQDEIKGKIYTNCEYGIYVNYGTGSRGAKQDVNGNTISHRADWKGQAPQPFMDTAYLYGKNNNVLEKQVKKVVQEEIKKMESGKK